MCISIIFCIKPEPERGNFDLPQAVRQKAFEYGYGCGVGAENLHPPVAALLKERFTGYLFFEIHDLEEPHCACDIDQDIRNMSRGGEESLFFRLVKDILTMEPIGDFAVLFADNDSVEGRELRTEAGGFGRFFERLNKWYTWQEEGYEPTRNAYFVADNSPLLFTLVNNPAH